MQHVVKYAVSNIVVEIYKIHSLGCNFPGILGTCRGRSLVLRLKCSNRMKYPHCNDVRKVRRNEDVEGVAPKEFPFTSVWDINKNNLAYFCENSLTPSRMVLQQFQFSETVSRKPGTY